MGTIDSHMMKNTEWGAVAYLAHSKYGRNGTEVSINNASGYNSRVAVVEYTTGYSGGTSISARQTDTTYSYETPQGKLASTTGNIYGVYDMSGGAEEYVAGIHGSSDNSIDYLQNIVNATTQYKNIYTTYSASQYGDAVYETSNPNNTISSWYEDSSYFVNSSDSVFARGGNYNDTLVAGLFFFLGYDGYSYSNYGFRPVLVVSAE